MWEVSSCYGIAETFCLLHIAHFAMASPDWWISSEENGKFLQRASGHLPTAFQQTYERAERSERAFFV